ncbi:hypothetical protein B0H15DRAFT_292912 [Mycena belliarum]|uniref:Uncharacterized protein n=1 Tax=Mycena belliarum TaxID=1033014 RepID=A0AAD6XP26_9AGAR|nr:hypothetical protein B0H15DRAFT_292912 [Mycena belliae]
MTDDGDQRWAAHAWRARLCTRYTAWAPVSREGSSSGESLAAGGGSVGNSSGGKKGEEGREEPARGGAPPGRIGRVYELGSFSGLWAGTMLMPSEPHYTALVTAPGGAFPPGGLERDDFIAAARPVYMRIAEHHSTTGEEGMRAGWLPHGARFLPRAVLHQAGHTQVEVRVDGAAAGNGSFEAQFGYAGVGGGYGAAFGAGGLEAGGGREDAYVYETVGERGRVREGAHAEGCPGCARAEERARWRRAGGDAEMREELSGRETSSGRRSDASYESQWQATSALASLQAASPSTSSSQGPSSSSQAPASLDKHSPSSQAPTSSQDPTSASQDTTSAASQSWPEWDAPVWAEHRFADDEGWEACDGVQDVVFTGATDPRHGMAWHHYEYAGRVRPWDGLIGLVMRPDHPLPQRDRTLGLATYFISGHLVGRNTFEGSWQMSAQDVLAPSWGGSICLARGEE